MHRRADEERARQTLVAGTWHGKSTGQVLRSPTCMHCSLLHRFACSTRVVLYRSSRVEYSTAAAAAAAVGGMAGSNQVPSKTLCYDYERDRALKAYEYSYHILLLDGTYKEYRTVLC